MSERSEFFSPRLARAPQETRRQPGTDTGHRALITFAQQK